MAPKRTPTPADAVICTLLARVVATRRRVQLAKLSLLCPPEKAHTPAENRAVYRLVRAELELHDAEEELQLARSFMVSTPTADN